jgi:hypothetical protein
MDLPARKYKGPCRSFARGRDCSRYPDTATSIVVRTPGKRRDQWRLQAPSSSICRNACSVAVVITQAMHTGLVEMAPICPDSRACTDLEINTSTARAFHSPRPMTPRALAHRRDTPPDAGMTSMQAVMLLTRRNALQQREAATLKSEKIPDLAGQTPESPAATSGPHSHNR